MRPQKLDLNNKGDGRVLQAMSIQRTRLPVFQGDPRAGNPGTSYEPDTRFVSVAQSVEHLTFNQGVAGSNPVGDIQN